MRAVVDLSRTDLFDLADRRLKYLDKRASLLAENIANADTPKWHAHDLKPFDAALQEASVVPERTNPMHLSGTSTRTPGSTENAGEHAPDGNDVQVDVELSKLADTETSQTLVTNLYSQYIGLFRTALGK
jgi:flagellar basal-body rod protein FlgB